MSKRWNLPRGGICQRRGWDWQCVPACSFGSGARAQVRAVAQAHPWRAGARRGWQVGPGGWTPPRHPPPAPSALVPPPSTSPSPKPERDWWRRLSLGGGRALRSAALAAAAAAFPLAVRAGGTAEAPGGWRWEAARPRTQAVAKFPRRAYWGSQLPATRHRSEKGSEIFNLGKIRLFSFVRLSLRAANGGSAKLGHRGSAASRLRFGESRDSGARVPRRPGRARGCERGAIQGAHREEGPGALYGGGSPEWCAPGRPKLWCPLA